MSFSDFGRNAIAALSTTVSITETQPSGVENSRNCRRSSDPMPQRRSREKTTVTTAKTLNRRRGSDASQGMDRAYRRRSDGGCITDRKGMHKNVLEIQRGVRPRLDYIQCPVTQKTLMDDVLTVQSGDNDKFMDTSSLASTSISSTNHGYSDDANEDDSEDTDQYINVRLNHLASQDEANSRNHVRSNSNKHGRNSSYLDGRKIGLQDQEGLEEDFNSYNTLQKQRRRRPKHYNKFSEAETYGGRTNTHSKHRHDSPSKLKRVETPPKKSKDLRQQSQLQSSHSSKLPTGVIQFQKMVAELESLSRISASSPEAMFKFRVLLRSTKDVDRELQLALEREHRCTDMNKEGNRPVAVAVIASSRKKLMRDYLRAADQFRSIVEIVERCQRADISALAASEATVDYTEGGRSVPNTQSRGVTVPQEDFFDRAMREREVRKISEGMNKVQEIYTDLAELVDSQQEQIDKLEDINDEVKVNTRAGLGEIQHGMWKLCVVDAHEKEIDDGNSFECKADRGKSENKIPNPSGILSCMMVCREPPTGPPSGQDSLSLDEADLYCERELKHKSSNARSNYYSDNVLASDSMWNLSKLGDLQESAQNAYERGHSMVGDIVEQVVTRHEGLPIQFSEIRNCVSCTPKMEEYSSFGDHFDFVDNANIMGSEDAKTSKTISDENYFYQKEEFDLDSHRHHRHCEGDRQRSRSRHRSRHRSKP